MSEQPPTTREGSEEHEQEPKENPRIYVASLSDYNAGRLHGSWLDAAQSAEALWLASARCWRRHQSRSPKSGPSMTSSPLATCVYRSMSPWKRVSEIRLGIRAWSRVRSLGVSILSAMSGTAFHQFEECYMGQLGFATEYAESILDSFGLWQAIEEAVPEPLQPYIRIDAEALRARPVARW